MITAFSFRIITALILFTAIMTQLAHAQSIEEDDDSFFTATQLLSGTDLSNRYMRFKRKQRCPEEFMKFYKGCEGPVVSCVSCIEIATKQCFHEESSSYRKYNGNCDDCSAIFTKKCGPVTPMCFGYQDCGGRNNREMDGKTHCINFKCVYLGSIKLNR